MKKELDEKLCAKYPKIFRNRFGDMQLTCMCWGFSCGDGWYNLIDNLCATLQKISDKHSHQVVASQVKEKFGTLRFYTEGLKPEMCEEVDAAIRIAEIASSLTCEICGEAGELGGEGWYSTLCQQHREKRGN